MNSSFRKLSDTSHLLKTFLLHCLHNGSVALHGLTISAMA